MENIEAMLCAYIEGDLAPADRAEIERHLRDNPQHRNLLDDLVSMRAVLRDLPRIPAPPEVSDGLRSNSERSMLLDDSRSLSISGRSDSRWWQYAAIAAIFLLTTGVGIVVYQMLPSLQPARFTELPPATEGKTEKTDEVPAPAGVASDATQPGTFGAGQALANGIPSTLRDRQMRTVSNSADGAAASVYSYWVVDSANPANTHDKINSFLSNNGITFTPITEELAAAPMPVPGMDAHGGTPVVTSVIQRSVLRVTAMAPTTNPSAPPEALAAGQSPTSQPSQLEQAKLANGLAGYAIHGITQKQIDQLENTLQAPNIHQTKHIYRLAVEDKSAAALGGTQRNSPTAPQESQSQIPVNNLQNSQTDLLPPADDRPVDVVILVQHPETTATAAQSPTTQPTTQPVTPP